MSVSPLRPAILLMSALAAAAPAMAQPRIHGGWDRPGWESPGFDQPAPRAPVDGPDSREGRVDVAGFLAQDAIAQLGHGAIATTAPTSGWPDTGGGKAVDDIPVFEAAVIDQLVAAGYDTATPDPKGGQVAEIRVLRSVLDPPQAKPKPVNGEMTVGVSNRGSMVGMALAVDLRKPKAALVSTRLEARVRDRVSGKLLWEGHADIATYEGDTHWSDDDIAARLASALFKNFPDLKRDILVDGQSDEG